nr:hypothetical protein [Tanacetum cinerariifolium]
MADMTAPSGQTPAVAPPVRTDEEIVPFIRWVQIGKSNCSLDLDKKQSNPIFKMAVDILMHNNFHRAFTASSTIPSIYIRQFCDTIQYDKKAGSYRCQLDEQWLVLTNYTLREALQITPIKNNQAFLAPPSADVLVDFINQLGYPNLVRNMSNIVTNDMFQPWKALTTIINLCLTGKTSRFERPRAPVLQILWGIVTQSNIDYAERIWEEFTQSIHTFIEDKRNLSRHTTGKEKATLIVIPSIYFTKLIIHHLQRRHKFHPRFDSPLHLPDDEPVLKYLKFSTKGTKKEVFGMPIPANHRRFLAGETRSAQDSPTPKPAKPARKPKPTTQKAPPRPSVSTSVASAQPAPTSAPAKRKQATETSDKPAKAKRVKHSAVSKTRKPRSFSKSVAASKAEEVPTVEPQVADEDVDYQKALEESMKTAYALPCGPLPPVVIKEPESRKYQPLLEVPGKGKAKVTEEQRRTFTTTGSFGLHEPSYAKLERSESESMKKVVPGDDKTGQGESKGWLDQTLVLKLKARWDQTLVYKMKHLKARLDQTLMKRLKARLDQTLVMLKVICTLFEDLFFNDKPSEADNDKSTTEIEVKSMVSVTIQQDMSTLPPSMWTIPPMTSPIVELTLRPESPKAEQQFKATTTETTTTTLPPPTAQQQSITEAMMIKRIGELEHIMADLLKVNKEMEARLDKHRLRLYTLEQLDIPQQVSKAVSEVVTEAVDWAMQAPLRNRFRDLPEADLKKSLHQHMLESESYKSHEDHMQLFEGLEKSMNHDQSEELTQDLAEARKRKKKSRESPKTPPGSPPHQPPPPPPPAGPFGAPGASGSSQ